MRTMEFTFYSANSEHYAKPVPVFCLIPERTQAAPGAMLFTHGWGGNRYQHRDKMEETCQKHNLICLSAEYRQSGYDFDPVTGLGWTLPYDTSLYQTFDVLNALRALLFMRPDVDRGRLYHYGGSQGGHIALLCGVFAPDTFAFIYASCPMTHVDPPKAGIAGREFADWELAARDVRRHAANISCPVYLEHGTADDNVDCLTHSGALAAELKRLGKKAVLRYYEGGGHDLKPATDKLSAFREMTGREGLLDLRNGRADDFLSGNKLAIPCGRKVLRVDWSRRPEDPGLFYFEDPC